MSRVKLALVAALFGVTAIAVAAPQNASKAEAKPAAAKIDPKTVDGGAPTWLKPETPKQRMQRLGVTEDPGPDPDPNRVWRRFGKEFKIAKYERRFARYDDPEFGWIRPFAFVFARMELYQHNEKWVWVWEPVVDIKPLPTTPIPPPSGKREWDENSIRFLKSIRGEFAPLDPPAASKTIRFEAASEGLPRTGSWRNSLAVADMNGDGYQDIIVPPARGAVAGYPSIFLGDGTGRWKNWQSVEWPHNLQYGSVAAADLNKDGHVDLAFGSHLSGVFVFLGDGKGKFAEADGGSLTPYPSRRVRIADVDVDGWLDVVAITEGPNPGGIAPTHGPVVVLLNRQGTRFEPQEIVKRGTESGGDWLTVANFNEDATPDFFLGSIYFNGWNVLFTSSGPMKWTNFREQNDGNVIPSIAYHFGSTAGRFSSAKRDDAVFSYIRFWPTDLDPKLVAPPQFGQVTAVDRLVFGANGKPVRTPLMRWGGGDPVMGIGSADFDGDGNLDVLFTRGAPREAVVLLGDGKGGFARAALDGLAIAAEKNYDVMLADVNGDKKPDVILNYEAAETRNALVAKSGSIQVFLNRGTEEAKPASSASIEQQSAQSR